MKRLCSSQLCLGLLFAFPLGGGIGGVLSLTPAQQAIHDAASIQDPEKRQDALDQVIRAGLLSQDRTVRDDAFKYLAENVRWMDLRPYAATLEAFNKIDRLPDRALVLLDHSALMHAPRQGRDDAYRRAIVEGGVRLHSSWTLTREMAISFAWQEGIEDLASLIREHLDAAFSDERASILSALELRAGGANREDAARLAAGRLAAMRDAEFRLRMETDSGFRAAVIRVAQDACAVDPFLLRRNTGCTDMRSVVSRQMALERDSRKAAAESAAAGSPASGEEPSESWLARLRPYVRDVEIRPSRR